MKKSIKIGLGVALAAAIIAAVYIFRHRKKVKDEKEAQALAAAKAAITETPANKSNVTLSNRELEITAIHLYEAMKPVAGTNETQFWLYMNKAKNKDDLKAIIAAFGTHDGKDLRAYIKSEPDAAFRAKAAAFFKSLEVSF